MPIDRLTTTGAEPVDATEAATAARLDDDTSGALAAFLSGAITAAREQAEQITGRVYRSGTFLCALEDWPAADQVIPVHGATAVAVTYWDGAAWAALAGGAYVWDVCSSGLGIVLAPITGTSWPTLGDKPVGQRVRITITAGPASAAAVPESVKLYIKANVSAWVRNPDAVGGAKLEPNPAFASLLDRERLYG